MRLLNTSSITLEEFQGSPPEYAILSHTWLDGEVTLQDLTLDKGRTKAGWDKILNCCRKCLKDGWKYVWIDTCCIDKTSSTELSEAINSMFAWYQRAAVCYAFLSDVWRVRKGDELETLARSRWFTRGWTLQELLAPLYLVFIDSSWREIGSRSFLSSTIETITGISAYQMAHFRGCSIATKMSWAAGRQTTRIEDEAYCLLGLFGINMPLLYGEEEKAFIRLQQEILRVSDDETIFAWRETTISPNHQDILCGMLARSPICFARSSHYEPAIIDEKRAEYAMTNKGLGMTIDVWRYIGPEIEKGARPRRYLAPLNCWSMIDNKAVAVILLHEGEESYVRTDPHELALFYDEVSKTDLWELIPRKRLYVRQVEEYSGAPKDLLQSVYHFTFHATYAIHLRKLYEYPSGSYITARILDYEDIYHDSNHLTVARRSFQMLILMDIADMELVLCVSTFNNFFALSVYVKSDFPKMTDILDEAEAALKQATDTVHLGFPEQNFVFKARIRPKPTLDDEAKAEIIEKSVQLDIDCQTYDYFDPFEEWDLLPEHLNPEWRPVPQDQEPSQHSKRNSEPRRRYSPSPSSLPYQEPPTERVSSGSAIDDRIQQQVRSANESISYAKKQVDVIASFRRLQAPRDGRRQRSR